MAHPPPRSRNGVGALFPGAAPYVCGAGVLDEISGYEIGSNLPPARLDPEWLAEPPSGSTEMSTAS